MKLRWRTQQDQLKCLDVVFVYVTFEIMCKLSFGVCMFRGPVGSSGPNEDSAVKLRSRICPSATAAGNGRGVLLVKAALFTSLWKISDAVVRL